MITDMAAFIQELSKALLNQRPPSTPSEYSSSRRTRHYKPKAYENVHASGDIETWMGLMERFYNLEKIPDDALIDETISNLSGDAYLAAERWENTHKGFLTYRSIKGRLKVD